MFLNGGAVQGEERERMLSSLTDVGRGKPVGYLPLHTVTDVLGEDPSGLAGVARTRGLSAIVLQPHRCCISSGALYVYDRVALRRLLRRAKSQVHTSGLSTNPDRFVKQIAAIWFELDDPIKPIIRAAFGDETRDGRRRSR